MDHFKPQFSKEDQELAPEIEWLLQSQQYSADQIAEELVKLCFMDLYCWMLLCLDEREAAAAAAVRTVLAAAENAYRYPGEIGALVWVFRLGVREIRRLWPRLLWNKALTSLFFFLPSDSTRAGSLPETSLDAALWLGVDSLPGDYRLALNLACGLGWEPDRIAQVLEISPGEVTRLLQQAIQAVFARGRAISPDLGQESLEEQIHLLTVCLARRQAQLIDESLDLAELAGQAGAEFARQAQHQSRSLRWKETLWLAGTAGVIALGLWVINLWLPEPESPPALTGILPLSAAATQIAAAAQTTATHAAPGLLVEYHVNPGDTLPGVADVLGVTMDELNRFNPGLLGDSLQAGQTLTVRMRPADPGVFPTPIMPNDYPLEPVPDGVSTDYFLNWLAASSGRWATIWMDGVILDYGPEGLRRAPEQTHFQAWFSKPDRDLTLLQGSGEFPDRVLTLGDLQYQKVAGEQTEIRMLAPRLGAASPRSLVYPNQQRIIEPPAYWNVTGKDRLAGRDVLVADRRQFVDFNGVLSDSWYGPDTNKSLHWRFWIDARTGVILRWQEFSGHFGVILAREMVVNSIQYDRVFSQADLFSPMALNDQVFLNQDSGWLPAADVLPPILTQTPVGRERFVQNPPGPGFDPASAQLSFQYPEGSPANKQQVMADVFADTAYLGQIVLSNPETMLCVRSQDGRQLAYTYDPFGNPEIMGIGWFRLEYPLRLNRLEIPLIPNSLAFSPDGRNLAYFASPLYASLGSLSVIDTETGRKRQMAQLIYADSLVWDPQSKFLAMIVADPEPDTREVRILDVQTGSFVYQHKISIDSILSPRYRGPDWPAADWPARAWGVSFPAPSQGMLDCLQP